MSATETDTPTDDTTQAQQPQQPDAQAPAEAEVKADTQGENAEQEEGGDKPAETRERDDKGRFKGVQPRIDELTRARREAEREAAYWRGLAQQGQQPQQDKPAAKPTADQYQDFGEYVEALTDWKARQAAADLLQQRAQAQQQEARTSTWSERVAEARQRMPDYDEIVATADAPVARHVAEVLMESPKGPELAYHFARNPQELARINSLPPVQAALEVGRLEASIAQTKPAAAPAARTTNAPKPASVNATNGRGASLDPSRMSMDEYVAYRKTQGARWAR